MVTVKDDQPRVPPQLPGSVPWLGHAITFGRDPVHFLRRARERFGDAFSFRLLGNPVVFLCGPAAHEAVFRAAEALLSRKEAYKKFMTPVLGEGVAYDAEPAVMDEQLDFFRHALTSNRLHIYAEMMNAEAESYFGSWGDRGDVDLCDVMEELALTIVSRCLVGAEFRDGIGADLPRLFRDMEGGIKLAGFLNPYLPLPPFRRRDRARIRIVEFISRIMAERRRTNTAGHEDVLATLMDSRYADGTPLPDHVVAGLTLALIFAAQESTALAAWTGVLLLEHQQHLPGLLAEQTRLFTDDPAMTLAKLHQMERLDRCIKEAGRMHPPVVMLMRKALSEFVHGGWRVPRGTLVMLSPPVSHRLPEVFQNPDIYDPDRFSPGREEDRRTPYSLIGFGGGKYRCIGTAFAYQQIKVIWSVLLRQFELRLRQSPNLPDYSKILAGPRRPCLVSYRRRDH